jgi:hypothetical protein
MKSAKFSANFNAQKLTLGSNDNLYFNEIYLSAGKTNFSYLGSYDANRQEEISAEIEFQDGYENQFVLL